MASPQASNSKSSKFQAGYARAPPRRDVATHAHIIKLRKEDPWLNCQQAPPNPSPTKKVKVKVMKEMNNPISQCQYDTMLHNDTVSLCVVTRRRN